MKALVPLAEGFEEIEAVSIIDVLRRAGIEVVTAHIGKNPVNGSHNIPLIADLSLDDCTPETFDAMILPGGMPGSENLKNNENVIAFLKTIYKGGKLVGAICAAPMVLGYADILHGKQATCYPGFETELRGAQVVDKPVVIDSKVVTGRGAGCAIPFALEIVGILKGETIKNTLKSNLQVYWNL
ncbi:MAG: DJ-1/PfpI family protein [Spirochaetes bacterium]|nr:DJ-1/PfpI family protein [Spirochaetota bacterium]